MPEIDPSVTRAVHSAAMDLVAFAQREGLVVTIETTAAQPLAMGNYRLQVDVRPARRSWPRPARHTTRQEELLGVVRTAIVEGERIAAGEGTAAEQAQDKRDLLDTLNVIEHALRHADPALIVYADSEDVASRAFTVVSHLKPWLEQLRAEGRVRPCFTMRGLAELEDALAWHHLTDSDLINRFASTIKVSMGLTNDLDAELKAAIRQADPVAVALFAANLWQWEAGDPGQATAERGGA
ncbi:hypothetical protein [Acidovorax sp.]|uniref:hypothetical protein n=1 Tax=Acidovorax sp. TaxID=1872122 RepID=UPI003D05C185